ncbi:hypothetical protein [Cupriavidus sp. RAF12]
MIQTPRASVTAPARPTKLTPGLMSLSSPTMILTHLTTPTSLTARPVKA